MIAGQTDIYDMLGGPNMQIIAFNGFKGSGKGEAAFAALQTITASNPSNPYVAAFADRVKLYVGRILGYEGTDEYVINAIDQVKNLNRVDVFEVDYEAQTQQFVFELTMRQMIQNVGHSAREMFGEYFWINQILPPRSLGEGWVESAEGSLGLLYPDASHLLIPDLRYPNEAERVRSYGGIVVEITRPGVESDGHDSEQPLPRHLVDLTIENTGDVAQLHDAVADWIAGVVA